MVSLPPLNSKVMPEAGDYEHQENLLIFHEFSRVQQESCLLLSRGGCINLMRKCCTRDTGACARTLRDQSRKSARVALRFPSSAML
jgi:hypothetical protein